MSGDAALPRESAHRRGVSLDAGRLQQLYERYAPDAAPVSVLHLREVPNGYNNKTFEARVRTRAGDEQHIAVRLSGAATWASTKALEEASALDFIHEATSIPVPRVRFAAAADAELHPDWSFVVMDWVSGQELTPAVWAAYSAVEKGALVEELAGVLLELRRIRFDWCGRVLSAASPYTAQLLRIAAPRESKSCGSAVVIAPPEFNGSTTTVGPFPSVYHSYSAMLDRHNQELLDYRGQYPRLDELLAFKDSLRELVEELKPDLLRAPMVLVHGDFAGRNILVTESSSAGNMTDSDPQKPFKMVRAVLDWEWLQTGGVHFDEAEGFDDFEDDLQSAVRRKLADVEAADHVPCHRAGSDVHGLLNEYLNWGLSELLREGGDIDDNVTETVETVQRLLGEKCARLSADWPGTPAASEEDSESD